MTRLATIFLFIFLLSPAARAQDGTASSDAGDQLRPILKSLKHTPHVARSLNDRLQEVMVESWNGTDWANASHVVYTYDGGMLSSEFRENWTGEDWINSSRTTYEYEDGMQTAVTHEQSTDGEWEFNFREEYTYEDGAIQSWLWQSWDGTQWVNDSRTTYVVNDGFTVETQSESWNGSDWEPTDRSTTVEEDGDIVSTFQSWNGAEWVNDDRFIYPDMTIEELYTWFEDVVNAPLETFGFGFWFRVPSYLTQVWDGAEWVNEFRNTTVLDGQGRSASTTFEEWADDAWMPQSRHLFAYDNGHLTSLEQQVYDTDAEEWARFSVESYEYDSNDNLSVVLKQNDFFGTGLENGSRYLLTWTSTTSSEDELPAETFALDPAYPNPFNPSTTLTYHVSGGFAAVRVYSTLGRLVATLAEGVHPAGVYEVAFDGAGLPSGHYLVRLESAEGRTSRLVTLLK